MKFECQVEVVFKLYVDGQKSGRFVKSTLVIGSEPRKVEEKFILHSSTRNKSGVGYMVKNFKHVFEKLIDEGSVTLRFEEPLHDLYVKCEVTRLNLFVQLLNSCDWYKTEVPNLANINVTIKDHASTKLHIYNRRSYQAKDLLHTLETLCIKGIQMYRFPKEVLNLNSLHILDLSNNNIEKIPQELGNLTLRELCLANNNIGIHNDNNWKWLSGNKLSSALKLLDLSGNGIKKLPRTICRLQQLITLRIGNNKLKDIPGSIGRLKNLRCLVLAHNYLRSLPSCLLDVKLDEIDISSRINYWEDEHPSLHRLTNECACCDEHKFNAKSVWKLHSGTLLTMCAKTILSRNIQYHEKLPHFLIDFLDDLNVCMCGKSFGFLSELSYRSMPAYFKTVIADKDCRVFLFNHYFCSKKCYYKEYELPYRYLACTYFVHRSPNFF